MADRPSDSTSSDTENCSTSLVGRLVGLAGSRVKKTMSELPGGLLIRKDKQKQPQQHPAANPSRLGLDRLAQEKKAEKEKNARKRKREIDMYGAKQ